MSRHSPSRTAREHWKQRYISALISALGAATILRLDGACKTLHALSSEAMGLTSPEKSGTLRAGTTPGTIKTEGNKMKNDCKYFEFTSAGHFRSCIIRDLGSDKFGKNWIEFHDLDNFEIWNIQSEMPANPFQADSALNGLHEKHLFFSPDK